MPVTIPLRPSVRSANWVRVLIKFGHKPKEALAINVISLTSISIVLT